VLWGSAFSLTPGDARAQVRVPPPPPLLCSQLEFARTLLTEHLVRVLTTASDLEMLDAASYSIQVKQRGSRGGRL
jgi:hypothetical protein